MAHQLADEISGKLTTGEIVVGCAILLAFFGIAIDMWRSRGRDDL